MTTTEGHSLLTADQKRFKATLAHYPRLLPFWDFQKGECDIHSLNAEKTVLSEGECILADFFMAIWLGHGKIEIVAVARCLGDRDRLLVSGWLADPYYP